MACCRAGTTMYVSNVRNKPKSSVCQTGKQRKCMSKGGRLETARLLRVQCYAKQSHVSRKILSTRLI